jgi:hypothetical protein
VKNTFNKSDPNVKAAAGKIASNRQEYEQTYASIRDKLGAHWQHLPMADLFGIWNDIDLTTVGYFVTESQDIYNLLHALDSTSIPVLNEIEVTIPPTHPREKQREINIAADSLALTRQNTISSLPTNKIQIAGKRIVSIFDSYEIVSGLHHPTLGNDVLRTTKAMMILDLISVVDNLYPYTASDPKHQQDSFLEILQRSNIPHQILIDARPRGQEISDRLRTVRNTICAHIENSTTEPLNNLLTSLDQIDSDLLDQDFQFLSDVFEMLCRSDVRLEPLTLHKITITGEGIIGTEDTGLSKDFD